MTNKITTWVDKLPRFTSLIFFIALILNVIVTFRETKLFLYFSELVAKYGYSVAIGYSVGLFLRNIIPLFILSLLFAWVVYLLLKPTIKTHRYWNYVSYMFLIFNILLILNKL